MADITYQFSRQEIIDGMTKIRTTQANIEQAIVDLETYAASQLQVWSSDADEQYKIHKQQWDTNVKNMNNILTLNALPSLQRMLDNYETADATNKRMWAN